MSSKMLVDATQPEETRVAIISKDNNRLEDFDFESNVVKQIKGNIFLAKVTRVEPSLQATFLEYGGNRQGFLPFSEIHLDYFRIPVADRQKLLEQEKKILEQAEAQDDSEESLSEDLLTIDEENPEDQTDSLDSDAEETEDQANLEEDDNEETEEQTSKQQRHKNKKSALLAHKEEGDLIDQEIGPNQPKFRVSHRNYKIQEVIKPRQIMLVQASKEERGNKGAAITTYISLPGRYCVLMPNSPRGGGVSRKINNPKDRKKMKKILDELNLPEGMSVILRTAGIEKSKTDIKRDLNYLLRLWNTIREETLKSTAPALIYEEADLIKRSIRDLYHADIEEVYVAGKEGYKRAKDFMKLLMPSHAKKVKEYKKKTPIFQAHHVESQIDDIFKTTAELKSGGYLVINPTEALVSIDVNSGRSTKERHIEETALRTNMEAAEELARQLRLRDLGGLIVVDFIDMETYKHNRQVERKMRECMNKDRARTQIGKISNFGLMELSRQRLRPSLFETNFETCSNCEGTGRTRTIESMALMVLRSIENEHMQRNVKNKTLTIKIHPDVALYLFNHKRPALDSLEKLYECPVLIAVDPSMPRGSLEFVNENEPSRETPNNATQPEKKSSHNAKFQEEKGSRPKKRGKRGGRRRQNNNNNRPQENTSNQRPMVESSSGDSASVDSEAVDQPKATEAKPASNQEEKSDKKVSSRRGRRAKPVAQKQETAEDGQKTDPIQNNKKNSAAKKNDSVSMVNQALTEIDNKNEVPSEKTGEQEGKRKGWWKRLREND